MASIIIPVKRLSRAKSRLDIPPAKRIKLCRMMLKEVLRTLSRSSGVDEVIIVSQDSEVLDMAAEYGAVCIRDEKESGVNDAVSLGSKHVRSTASIVIPQDIPFIKEQDVDFLLRFASPSPCVLVVPSRRFDGTNALYRSPPDAISTHYDEDSYTMHMDAARLAGDASLVFVRRIMMDIDDVADLQYCISQNAKPELCSQMAELLRAD